jgi:hypothetical protein
MSASACVTVSRSPTRSRGIARQSSTHADADDTASGAHGHSSAREALRVARARRVRSHVARRASRRVASLDGRTARVVPDSTSMCGRDATRRAAEDRGSRIKKNPRATRIKRERFAMKAETRDARSISNDRSIDRSIDRTNERSNDRSTDERFEGAAKPNARR